MASDVQESFLYVFVFIATVGVTDAEFVFVPARTEFSEFRKHDIFDIFTICRILLCYFHQWQSSSMICPGMELPDGLKVYIATPAYGGQVTVDYMTSVIHMVTQLKEVAWQLSLVAGQFWP